MLERLLAAIRAIVEAELARTAYLGVYEYVVQGAGPGTVDVAPASSLPLPALTGVPLVSSLLGQTVTPAVAGQRCRIRFVNGDPTRPVCTGLGAPPASSTVDATGTLSLGPGARIVVLAGGSADLAREGDAVTVFLPPGALSGGAGELTILTGFSGILQSLSKASA